MMRNCIVFALVAVAMVAASQPREYSVNTKTADMDFLIKQKKIFDLLMHVDQGILADTEYYEVGKNYDIFTNIDFYKNREVVMDFMLRYKVGFLRKDAIFTYFNEEQREEMVLLYRLLYVAKDFNTFYKTACWARININPSMFMTAFTTAVIYRDDTKYIRLPAIYEMYPSMFFDTKVIRDAQRFKMTRGYGNRDYGMDFKQNVDNVDTFFVYSNFEEMCINPTFENEYKLKYFMNDIGLNAFYYYFRMAYPFWLDTKDYNLPSSFRGDFYFFIHKQLMNRYYLERFSNGLREIEDFTWDRMNLPAYYPDITYYNSVALPRRDWWNIVPFYKYKYVEYVKKLETRILEAIDSGFAYDNQGKQINIYTPEGLNYLGNLIEGNCDSINLKYYGAYDILSRDILGGNFDCKCKNYYIPSTLQLFSTSLRDPAFYRLYNRILFFFHRYKTNLNRYTKNDLYFPGVKIENVDVDKMVTYYDVKDFFINNAVAIDSYKDGRSFNIKTWQYYLNYKPFNYRFAVNSEKDTKAVVRIFLGPTVDSEKYNNYSYLLHYYKYFFMLDEFDVDLKSGLNNLERRSADSMFFKNEVLNGDVYYKKITNAIEGHEPFTYSNRVWGFPQHLMLPKGSVDGMRFKLFVYIGAYENFQTYEVPFFGNVKFYGKSFGFPLDRPMNPWFFMLDNVFFKDVFIYHTEDYDKKYMRQY